MDGLWRLAELISSPAAAVFLHLAAAAAVFLIYCKATQADRPRDLLRHGLVPAWLAAPVCGWLSLQLAGGMLAGALGRSGCLMYGAYSAPWPAAECIMPLCVFFAWNTPCWTTGKRAFWR